MIPVSQDTEKTLSSRGSRRLLESIQKRLAFRMAELETGESLALLRRIRDELLSEESLDSSMAAEFNATMAKLSEARLAHELPPLYARLCDTSRRHFATRSSAGTFQEFLSTTLETLLVTSCTIAVEHLRQEGEPAPQGSWCLLAADSLGRMESTLGGQNCIILAHEESDAQSHQYFHRLAIRLMAILADCGIPTQPGLRGGGTIFWHGSIGNWREQLLDSIGPMVPGQSGGGGKFDPAMATPYDRGIELIADLRPIWGDKDLSDRVMEMSAAFLAWESQREEFRQLARRVATMPVALGMFGRFRTARSGSHRGQFSMEEMATRPLVASVRMLAILSGIRETSTAARIRALLAGGGLGVAIADRLLLALNEFVRCQIKLEIAHGGEGEEYFLNPDVLGHVSRERLKSGLEDLTTLQRLLYQQIAEVSQ